METCLYFLVYELSNQYWSTHLSSEQGYYEIVPFKIWLRELGGS